MRRSLLLGSVALALLAGGPALAKSVCYEVVDPNDPETSLLTFVRWYIDYNGKLSSSSEAVAMRTYDLTGNFVTDFAGPDPLSLTTQGTITVGKGVGARAGIHSAAMIAANQWMALDCETEEDTSMPESWFCRILVYDIPTGTFLPPEDFDLVRRDPHEYPTCGRFGEIPTVPPSRPPAEE